MKLRSYKYLISSIFFGLLTLLTFKISAQDRLNYLMNNRINDINNTLNQDIPILKLELADPGKQEAQNIAANARQFFLNTKSFEGEAFFSEIFEVTSALQSELPNGFFQDGKIYKVVMYNFNLNLTTVSLVNIDSKKVFSVNTLPNIQPEVPAHLKELAVQIAANSEPVKKALGYNPAKDSVMILNALKTVVNIKDKKNPHLLVVSNFRKRNKSINAVVDLKDLKLVDVQLVKSRK